VFLILAKPSSTDFGGSSRSSWICVRDLGLLRDRDFLAKPTWGQVAHYVVIPHLTAGQRLHRGRNAGGYGDAARGVLHSALCSPRLKEDSFSCPTGQYIRSCGMRTTS